MPQVIGGIVKNGVIVPHVALPEGAWVEIHVPDPVEVPPELQEELEQWQRAGAESLEMVERMLSESDEAPPTHEKG